MAKHAESVLSKNIKSTSSQMLIAIVIAFLLGFGSGAFIWRSGQGVQQTQDQRFNVATAYKVTDDLIAAAAHLAQERGLVFTSLQSNKPGTPDVVNAIRLNRSAANEELERVITAIKSNFTSRGHLRFAGVIEADLQNIGKLRRSIDGLGEGRVPAGLASRWFVASSRTIRSCEELLQLMHLGIRTTGTDPETDVALKIQHIALVMSDLAGRERAFVSGALAKDEPISIHHGSALLAIRGRVNELWRQIKIITAAHELPQELQTHVDQINVAYFQKLGETKQHIELATATGQPISISAVEWFGQSSDAIDNMVDLGRKAGQFAHKRKAQGVGS